MCLYESKPVVEVKVGGVTQVTFPGTPIIPYWHKSFMFKLANDSYSLIEFRVVMQRKIGSVYEYGTFTVSTNELQDQQIYTNWIPIKLREAPSSQDFTPRIQVRIQYLHDLKRLVEDQQVETTVNLRRIEELLQACDKTLRLSSSIPMF
jgi:hypothetical protein